MSCLVLKISTYNFSASSHPAAHFYFFRSRFVKKSCRRVSVPRYWVERSRSCVRQKPGDGDEWHDQRCEREISLFWEKYVKPLQHSKHITNYSRDSGHSSLKSESASLSTESSISSVAATSSESTRLSVISKQNTSLHEPFTRDKFTTVITITAEDDAKDDQIRDHNQKYKSKGVSRSNTLPLTFPSHMSCKTRLCINNLAGAL